MPKNLLLFGFPNNLLINASLLIFDLAKDNWKKKHSPTINVNMWKGTVCDEKHIYSFILNKCFILLRVSVDQEATSGTSGRRFPLR